MVVSWVKELLELQNVLPVRCSSAPGKKLNAVLKSVVPRAHVGM
jgi:hypothetical protein